MVGTLGLGVLVANILDSGKLVESDRVLVESTLGSGVLVANNLDSEVLVESTLGSGVLVETSPRSV